MHYSRETRPHYFGIDWSNLTIIPEVEVDGEANVLVDEDPIYEALGWKAVDEGEGVGVVAEKVLIPNVLPNVQAEMKETTMRVHDNEDLEVVFSWDITCYS